MKQPIILRLGEPGSRYNHRFKEFTHRRFTFCALAIVFLECCILEWRIPWLIFVSLSKFPTTIELPFFGWGYWCIFAPGVAEVYCADDLLDYNNYLHCWVWWFFTNYCPVEAAWLSQTSQEPIMVLDFEICSILQDEGLGETFWRLFWLPDHSHCCNSKKLVAVQLLLSSASFDVFVCKFKLVATHLHVTVFPLFTQHEWPKCLARIMIIFFIFGGVIFFGSETAEILEIFTDAEEGRGSYVNRWLRWKCLGEA